MKYRIFVDCNQEDWFQEITNEFKADYYRSKGKELDSSKMIKGFTYQKLSNRQENPEKASNVATITLLEYEYPILYRVSYVSNTFFRIIGMEVHSVSETRCEVIFEEYNEKLEDGKSKTNFTYDGSKEIIRKPKLMRKLIFKRTAKEIRRRKEQSLQDK